MKHYPIRFGVLAAVIIFFSISASAQLSITFSEPLSGTSPLWAFSIENPLKTPVSIGLRVSERQNGQISSLAELNRITIPSGFHTPQSLGIVGQAVIRQIPANTGQGGEITEICVEVVFQDGRITPFCTTLFSAGRMPPMLVFPFDRDTIKGPVPAFSWLPPNNLIGTPGLTYNLKMVKIREGQSKEVAINTNPALISQTNLYSNLWNYPLSAPAFEAGEHYAWQIAAFVNGGYYGRSEVWEFVENKSEVINPGQGRVSIDLDNTRTSYSIAIGSIGIYSKYGLAIEELTFKIRQSGGEEVRINNEQLRQINSRQVLIQLPAGSGLRGGSQYVLQVFKGNRLAYSLPFHYQFPEN